MKLFKCCSTGVMLCHYIVDMALYVSYIQVNYEKGIRTYACCPDPHPDITYTLHMRRRTFYYLFNIIVPCIMLSILTLLTFWLPTTSGEKISLGLSVFLAFSMFMLLIAEEVPATSESVPLIGMPSLLLFYCQFKLKKKCKFKTNNSSSISPLRHIFKKALYSYSLSNVEEVSFHQSLRYCHISNADI